MRVGFVGWRGMVGSVLLERMREERDFDGIESVFFSTSNVGGAGPDVGGGSAPLGDAHDLAALKTLDVVVTCQGGDWTNDVYGRLRESGWKGAWIDAASALRMQPEARIILDPVNEPLIRQGLADGVRTWVGGNCTVSLLLMAVAGLVRQGLVEWIAAQTYQAASGAGAQHMRELIAQMGAIRSGVGDLLDDPASAILEIDRRVAGTMRSAEFPVEQFGHPLAGSLLPWIDREMENGQSREEWKATAEAARILGREDDPLPIDGTCVRIGAMRCHAQGLTIKLNRDVPIADAEAILREAHEWVRVVPNGKEATLRDLTPTAVSGRLHVPIGRLRKMRMGERFLSAYTVGDQLLWGAAEPLRRMLRILREEA